MPRETTIGNANTVFHLTQKALAGDTAFFIPPDVDEVHIEFMPAGGLTLVLPGPTAIPVTAVPLSGESPNDGDMYSWKDPFGLVTNLNPLTIDGGGFAIGVPGHPPAQVISAAIMLKINGAEYTFNDALGLWVPCGCQLSFARGPT
jgi:hypothetical protein